MEYHKMKWGTYKGDRLDTLPMEYLIWLYGVLSHEKKDQPLRKEVLQYFLDQEIAVNLSSDSDSYEFFFNKYHYPNIDGTIRPFLISPWRGKDSNGNFVYEAGTKKYPIFFVEIDNKFNISIKYRSFNYHFGGVTMVYERTSSYYFVDSKNLIMPGAFLMRKPYIPEIYVTNYHGEKFINHKS